MFLFALFSMQNSLQGDVRVHNPGVWDEICGAFLKTHLGSSVCIVSEGLHLWYVRHDELQSLHNRLQVTLLIGNPNTFSHCTETAEGSGSDQRVILALEQRFGDVYV